MALIGLIVRYLIDFARANVTLAIQVLSPRLRFQPQTIELDTKVTTPLEVLTLSNLITFTPGTLTLDVKPGRRITVHVLQDGDACGQSIRQRLEAPLLQVTRGKR